MQISTTTAGANQTRNAYANCAVVMTTRGYYDTVCPTPFNALASEEKFNWRFPIVDNNGLKLEFAVFITAAAAVCNDKPCSDFSSSKQRLLANAEEILILFISQICQYKLIYTPKIIMFFSICGIGRSIGFYRLTDIGMCITHAYGNGFPSETAGTSCFFLVDHHLALCSLRIHSAHQIDHNSMKVINRILRSIIIPFMIHERVFLQTNKQKM